MKTKGQHKTESDAFTLFELIVVIATVAVLAGTLAPALSKSKSETHIAIDLNNTRQILKAVQMYAADNADYMPFPGWGTTATCWVHGGGIRSGALAGNATQAQLAAVISNQMTYFRKSQLAPFVNYDQTVFDCPTDVAMRRGGVARQRYMARETKLTTYGFCGAVSGFGAPKQASGASTGGTFKLPDFRPSSFLMWEPDETSPFNFNDAGINQENQSEGISQRHSGTTASTAIRSIGKTVGLVGRFGGDASFIPLQTFSVLRNTPPENDLRCGPGYR